MLENLFIKNVALIEECEINFKEGLNILTGETGAGKSMVLGSLQFALGGRMSNNKDFIRKGETMAKVEASFFIDDKIAIENLITQGIDVEDGSVIISRTLNSSGKNVCRMNGTVVTLSMLRELSASFVDIYGQHEYQSLLNANKHINLLDGFCGEEFQTKLEEYRVSFRKLKDIQKQIDSLLGDEGQREQKIDILTFQKKEIEDVNLVVGEEEILMKQRKTLAYSEKLKNLIGGTVDALYNGSENGASAIDNVGLSINNLQEAMELDQQIEPFYNELDEINARLDDVVREIKRYYGNLEEDPEALENIDDRLQIIQKLKRKYGKDIEEILKFYDKVSEQLDMLTNSEEEILKLQSNKAKEESKLMKIGKELSNYRKKVGKSVQEQIEKSLHDMEMEHGKFSIVVEEDEINSLGINKVEFLFSANLGETLKPLAKIASGGEMSRVMLALKVVLVDADQIGTFVFDEIDTGISGRTAEKVGEKMSFIGEKRQILCITHLPQIASKADSHFLIEKNVTEEKTVTTVKGLSFEDSVVEVARLLGGAVITKTTLAAAKELKKIK